MIAQALIAIIIFEEMNGLVLPIITSEGGKAVFKYFEPVYGDNFICSRKDVKLDFSGRYRSTESDGTRIFEISDVTKEDAGSYTCKSNDDTKKTHYSLIVIGPLKLDIIQRKNNVKLTCEAVIAKSKTFTLPPNDVLLQVLINEKEVIKTTMIDDENEVSSKTLSYEENLDEKIQSQNVTCKVKTVPHVASTSKEINISAEGSSDSIPKDKKITDPAPKDEGNPDSVPNSCISVSFYLVALLLSLVVVYAVFE